MLTQTWWLLPFDLWQFGDGVRAVTLGENCRQLLADHFILITNKQKERKSVRTALSEWPIMYKDSVNITYRKNPCNWESEHNVQPSFTDTVNISTMTGQTSVAFILFKQLFQQTSSSMKCFVLHSGWLQSLKHDYMTGNKCAFKFDWKKERKRKKKETCWFHWTKGAACLTGKRRMTCTLMSLALIVVQTQPGFPETLTGPQPYVSPVKYKSHFHKCLFNLRLRIVSCVKWQRRNGCQSWLATDIHLSRWGGSNRGETPRLLCAYTHQAGSYAVVTQMIPQCGAESALFGMCELWGGIGEGWWWRLFSTYKAQPMCERG